MSKEKSTFTEKVKKSAKYVIPALATAGAIAGAYHFRNDISHLGKIALHKADKFIANREANSNSINHSISFGRPRQPPVIKPNKDFVPDLDSYPYPRRGESALVGKGLIGGALSEKTKKTLKKTAITASALTATALAYIYAPTLAPYVKAGATKLLNATTWTASALYLITLQQLPMLAMSRLDSMNRQSSYERPMIAPQAQPPTPEAPLPLPTPPSPTAEPPAVASGTDIGNDSSWVERTPFKVSPNSAFVPLETPPPMMGMITPNFKDKVQWERFRRRTPTNQLSDPQQISQIVRKNLGILDESEEFQNMVLDHRMFQLQNESAPPGEGNFGGKGFGKSMKTFGKVALPTLFAVGAIGNLLQAKNDHDFYKNINGSGLRGAMGNQPRRLNQYAN